MSDGFHDLPPTGRIEDLTSGCFLFDRDRSSQEHPINSLAQRAFLVPSDEAYFNVYEASRNASFQLEKSLVYQDLKGSLGHLDEQGRFFGIGSLPYEQRNGIDYTYKTFRRCPQDIDAATPLQSKDSRREDAKETPMSLRILKRKHSRDKEIECAQKRRMVGHVGETGGDSFSGAFSSLVFMFRTLLNHIFNDVQQVMSTMHDVDMQESFVWLFQQVFCCTPKLMILVMLLLADFTLHSMGKYVALPVMPLGEPPTASVMTSFQYGAMDILRAFEDLSLLDSSVDGIRIPIQDFQQPSWPTAEVGEGNGGGRTLNFDGAETDGYPWPGIPNPIQSAAVLKWDHQRPVEGLPCEISPGDGSSEREDSASVMLKDELDQQTKQMFVAPVNVEVESDNYVCYDRTDLNYQHAISMDPHNPLLLSNYAQFLFLVRHDHDRAENLFRRATDPVDGEVMGRFANFLWVAKRDVAEADKAYRAAMDADPTNSFHAACYAHFLWDSGEQETSCEVIAA